MCRHKDLEAGRADEVVRIGWGEALPGQPCALSLNNGRIPCYRKNQYTIIEKCTHYADDEEELTVWGTIYQKIFPLLKMPVLQNTQSDDGEVDHALEEEEEVGIIGRGARKLQLPGYLRESFD